MTNSIVFDVLAIAAAIFVLWLLLKLFRAPLKLLFKLLINTGLGFVTLFLLAGGSLALLLLLPNPWVMML